MVEKRCLAEIGQADELSISSDDRLMFQRRLCMLADGAVKIDLLTKAHSSPSCMHSDSIKMYKDLKQAYWCCKMKRVVEDLVGK